MQSPFSEFESLGEEAVRLKVASLEWEGTQKLKALQWLEFESSRKRDAREERTLSIAEEANRIASRAERWAMYAAIAAVIALIIAIALK
jgi:hypothetical protein